MRAFGHGEYGDRLQISSRPLVRPPPRVVVARRVLGLKVRTKRIPRHGLTTPPTAPHL